MSAYSGRIVHATLAAATVDTITFDADYTTVEIVNRDGAAEIYATVDTGITPTVGGAGCDVLPAAIGSLTVDASGYGSPTTIKLISSGTPAYSVKGLL
ncbi:hypothetical protein [Streptomyces sp. NBC_01530]|uniref:hypothetical protein n=1 Tax=Streptomyces sp. NBC_01530 TaxID=2903895 RepID=UPI00386FB1DA